MMIITFYICSIVLLLHQAFFWRFFRQLKFLEFPKSWVLEENPWVLGKNPWVFGKKLEFSEKSSSVRGKCWVFATKINIKPQYLWLIPAILCFKSIFGSILDWKYKNFARKFPKAWVFLEKCLSFFSKCAWVFRFFGLSFSEKRKKSLCYVSKVSFKLDTTATNDTNVRILKFLPHLYFFMKHGIYQGYQFNIQCCYVSKVSFHMIPQLPKIPMWGSWSSCLIGTFLWNVKLLRLPI